MMTACRTANLEWLMQEQGPQAAIQPLFEAFSRVSNEDHRGTRLADEIHFPRSKPPKVIKLSPHIHTLLLRLVHDKATAGSHSLEALELEKFSISGVIYASEKYLPRDSNIIFRRSDGSLQRVGRITLIFQVDHQPGTTFLAVSQYRLIVSSDERNVYRRFGFAGGLLCDAEEAGLPLVIRSEDVICHFAKTALIPKEEKLMHALPLNTVCNLISNIGGRTDLHAENAGVSDTGGVPPPGMLSSTVITSLSCYYRVMFSMCWQPEGARCALSIRDTGLSAAFLFEFNFTFDLSFFHFPNSGWIVLREVFNVFKPGVQG